MNLIDNFDNSLVKLKVGDTVMFIDCEEQVTKMWNGKKLVCCDAGAEAIEE